MAVIIDKKGKIFGKISIVDVAVILLLVFCLLGAYVRFGSRAALVVSSVKTVEYTVEIKGVRQYTIDALKMGGNCIEQKTQNYIGEVISVSERSAEGVLQLTDGSFIKEPIPDRYDAVVTITTKGKADDNAIYDALNTELCVGSYSEVITKWVFTTGSIMSVRVLD